MQLAFQSADGVRLMADAFGAPAGKPVVFAHGGGQTRHAWRNTCVRLASLGYRAVAPDLRGHGASDWTPSGDYRLERFAEDLLLIADSFASAPAIVGASLGGMAALIAQGELASCGRRGFAAMVLVDIAPRVRADGVERIVGFMSSNMSSGFASPEEAADAIARYLPHRRRPTDLSGLRKNLRLRGDGRFYWHWDPRFLSGDNRREESRGSERLEKAAGNLRIPTLLIRGEQSELVDADSVRSFAAHVPQAEFADVVGAGHMVAGDENDLFSDTVAEFLLRHHRLGPDADAAGTMCR